MSSQPSPTTQISSPALMSKFSAESIKCNRPGWLSNFASHLRSPTSPSGTGTATKDRESLISNPELIMHGLARPNNQLGRGARIVNDCRAAFNETDASKEESSTEELRRGYEPADPLRGSRWSASTGTCYSEPGGVPVHRLKLPPRKSSRQQQETSRCKDSEPLPPLPTESNQLISASFDGRPSPRSSSNASEASASGSSSRKKHREKPIVAPPPLITDASTLTHFQPPSTPLHSSGPSPPFRALLLQPIQPPLPFVSDEAKLITLVISGQRFTISYSALTQKPSKLADFVQNLLLPESPPQTAQPAPAATVDRAEHIFRLSPMPTPMDVPGQHSHPQIIEPAVAETPMSAHATMFCLESEVPASINEEDWSADYEISPMPTATFHHLLQQQGQPRSSTPSSPPSLCTGSTARSSRVDMYTHGAASSSSSSSQVSSSRPADQAIEIFLDRPACAYTAVLAWLRSGRLPRSYNLTSTLDLFAEKLQDGRLELRNATSLPASQLALSLHPLISSLQDLMEESKWLGLKDLSEECEDRINELASWLRHQSRAEYTECQRNQDLRPRSQHFKRERRPRQARFYGSNVPPYTSLPHATPEDQRQGWI